jgi:hypothetical protein
MRRRPAAIKKLGEEAVVAMQLGDDGARFTSTKDNRHFGWPSHSLDAADKLKFAIQHALVKEEERAKGLVLGGSCHVQIDI